MKHKKKSTILSLTFLAAAVSCGGGGDSSKGGRSQVGPAEQVEAKVPTDGSNIQGQYRAMFTTLNPQVNGTIPGSASFFRQEDRIFAYIRLFAGGVKAWHPQHVYTGGRCPTTNDDTNGDGFIDILEAETVLGKILIPLDADISSQSAGQRFFPIGDLSGYYHYERITNFRRFLEDLQEPDQNPDDNVTKLDPGAGLSLAGRTVMIQGVVETVVFPETVATKGRFKPFQTLPIACGVFEEITRAPGKPYNEDEIPGPVADVEPGQDRPAPEDTDSTDESTTGNTSGTTGSNESDDGQGPVSDGEGRTAGTGGTGSTIDSSGTNINNGTTGDGSAETIPTEEGSRAN
jgi:hypothetical protein